jgi:hypothetical protein
MTNRSGHSRAAYLLASVGIAGILVGVTNLGTFAIFRLAGVMIPAGLWIGAAAFIAVNAGMLTVAARHNRRLHRRYLAGQFDEPS